MNLCTSCFPFGRGLIVGVVILAGSALPLPAQQVAPAIMKNESFDRDPGWEGFNNRMKPAKITTITQAFGYSKTRFAGGEPGEAGGAIQRSMMPAFYAKRIEPKTLEDRLTASGTFAATSSGGGGGVFFGFFNDKKTGSSTRPTNSLGMCFDMEASGGRLAVYLITANNKCWGNFVTPYIPGTFRPTPIKTDGSVHYTWRLDYDPQANDGNGRFQFTIKGDGPNPANFENRRLVVDIPAELRRDGATFEHFGLMNLLVDGGVSSFYFDNIEVNGVREDFSRDPNWEGSRNRGSFTEDEPHGVQNFGFSDTPFAGGKAGEVGGIFWRNGKGGHYADRVGPLSLEDRLEAGGKINLVVGATDADVTFGWFNSRADFSEKAAGNSAPTPNFLGVTIGGPTRIGHYFLPKVTTAQGNVSVAQATREKPKAGPVMTPGRATTWNLVYDPQGNAGNGTIRATLGEETVVLDLKPGFKAEGATFDRFGFLVVPVGGHHVKLYLDDLQYTAGRGAR